MKKRKLRKKKTKRKAQPRKAQTPPDRRMMDKTMSDLNKLISQQEFDSIDDLNAYMQQIVAAGPLPELEPETPLEEAQELMYQAFEAPTRRERIKLAKQALDISQDCADAYVLLAEEDAKSPVEAHVYYELGVAAGERAIGEEFDELVGYFWGVTYTRPYMRARAGLGGMLWALDKREEAIGHYSEMLRLNPGDNQGLRYTLFSWLLTVEDHDAAEALVAAYDDDAVADFLYNQVLLALRREGVSGASRAVLRQAEEWNPHVVPYLLGEKRLPRQLPEYIEFGGDSEASLYVAGNLDNWRATPGALDWLRENRA